MAYETFARYENTLDAKQIMMQQLASLPGKTVIKGSLALGDSSLEELPQHIDIFGNLDLSSSRVKKLSEDTRIYGDLILSRSRITSLPKHIFIEGNLVLKDSLVTELPEHMTVYGEIDLVESKITSLPDHLTVRCLSLANTGIKELPYYLTVEQPSHMPGQQQKPSYLDLKYSLITHIPDHADISNMDLQDTNVVSYGKKVKIQCLTLGCKEFLGETDPLSPALVIMEKDNIPFEWATALSPQTEIVLKGCSTQIPAYTRINCGLGLYEATLQSLPENLEIGGYLTIVDTPVESLPASTQVHQSIIMKGRKVTCAFPAVLHVRDLELYGTAQRELPEELFTEGYFVLKDSQIETLPINLEIGVNMVIRNNMKQIQIPQGARIKVGHSLFWKSAPFESWPENMQVCGGIHIADSAIRILPDNFLVNGTLDLSGSHIESLPENLTVLGDLLLNNTAITSLPDSLIVAGKIEAVGTTLTAEQCSVMANKTISEDYCCSWPEIHHSHGKLNKYTFLDSYCGCEIIEDKGERKLIRPLGQEEEMWIERNENGEWIGEFPYYKEYLPIYGY